MADMEYKKLSESPSLATALLERSHEGLAQDYYNLMQDKEAALKAARIDALKWAQEQSETCEDYDVFYDSLSKRIQQIEQEEAK